jgi:hypothetical protein
MWPDDRPEIPLDWWYYNRLFSTRARSEAIRFWWCFISDLAPYNGGIPFRATLMESSDCSIDASILIGRPLHIVPNWRGSLGRNRHLQGRHIELLRCDRMERAVSRTVAKGELLLGACLGLQHHEYAKRLPRAGTKKVRHVKDLPSRCRVARCQVKTLGIEVFSELEFLL